MLPGDIITGFDGSEVKSSQDVLARIASTTPGTRIKLVGVRGRARFESNITVRQRPKDL
jgi:S1-C subfamily serine protease